MPRYHIQPCSTIKILHHHHHHHLYNHKHNHNHHHQQQQQQQQHVVRLEASVEAVSIYSIQKS
jgi:hypothetical protein